MSLQTSEEFMDLTNWIRRNLPKFYFGGIIASYFINAVMIGFFLFPTLEIMIDYWAAIFISAIGTCVIQFFRGLIVFTDLLFAESGENSKYLVKAVALIMTLVGVFELWHLLSGFEGAVTNGQLIGVFVFGSSIIVGGWMMEINFIKQTNQYIYKSAQLHKLGQIEGSQVYAPKDFKTQFIEAYKEVLANKENADDFQKLEKSGQNPYEESEVLKQEDNSQKKTGITDNQADNFNDHKLYKENSQLKSGKTALFTEEEVAELDKVIESLPLPVNLSANFTNNGQH